MAIGVNPAGYAPAAYPEGLLARQLINDECSVESLMRCLPSTPTYYAILEISPRENPLSKGEKRASIAKCLNIS